MTSKAERKTGSDSPRHATVCLFLRFFSPFFLVVISSAGLRADQPTWAGEAGTTWQAYQFTTDSTQPVPEMLDNEYGAPTAAVTVTSPFGTGWQDPAVAFSTPGVDADGAWDIGPAGSIAISLPMAPPNDDPGLFYRVDFHVYVIAYEIPVALPVISAPGLVLEGVASSSVVVKQETIGRYKGLTWTAAADILSGNTATILLTATAAGAVVDSVTIHTRYTRMGEPGFVYAAWTEANYPGVTDPAIIGFEAAPDLDGIGNGLKYYLGWTRGRSGPVMLVESAAPAALVFRHTRNKTGTPDISGAYEWSSDLVSWHGDGETAGGLAVAFTSLTTDTSPPDFDWVETTATVTSGSTAHLFVRLTVTQAGD